MRKSTSVDAEEPLTTWCGECNAEADFEPVPGGMGIEYACRWCGAAVFAGDLPLIETVFQPGVSRPASWQRYSAARSA